MSAEGQAYVERYSPYKGDTYMIHLRIGMLTNETHQNTLFSGDKYLAGLCRCSVKTVQRAREKMTEDGYLSLISPATGRKLAVYRVLFPSIGGHFDHLPDEIGGHLVPNRWTSEETSPIYVIESNSKPNAPTESKKGRPRKNPEPNYTPEFEDFYLLYPKPLNKEQTFKNWNWTITKQGILAQDIINAARSYLKETERKGTDPDFIIVSTNFVGQRQRWTEYQIVAESPETLGQARAWDDFDSNHHGTMAAENPSPDFPRPRDSSGNLLDKDGRKYYIDPMDFKRRYVDDE